MLQLQLHPVVSVCDSLRCDLFVYPDTCDALPATPDLRRLASPISL